MKKRWFVYLMVVLLSLSLVAGCGGAKKEEPKQDTPKEEAKKEEIKYPTKPVTYVVPFNPGGQSDLEARRQQPILEKILGQKLIIESKPGAGGALGWSQLVKAKPDGYNLTGINIPHIILQPASRDDAGYKTEQINPIAIFQATPIGLAVAKDSEINTLDDFIKYAKENPGRITISGSGTMSGHDIARMQLEKLADIKVEYVPATGAAPSVQNFLGGHTLAIFSNSNDLVQHKDNMKILAIGSDERFEALPDVPTFKELGYDMTPSIDRGIAAPPGTPDEVMKILEAAFMEISNKEDIRKQMVQQGFVPKAMGMEESKAFIEKKTKEYLEILAAVKK